MLKFSVTENDIKSARLNHESPLEINRYLTEVKMLFESQNMSQYIIFPVDATDEFTLDSNATEERRRWHEENTFLIRSFFEKTLYPPLVEKYKCLLQGKCFRRLFSNLESMVGQVHREVKPLQDLIDIILEISDTKTEYVLRAYNLEHKLAECLINIGELIKNSSNEKRTNLLVKGCTDFFTRRYKDNRFNDALYWSHEQLMSHVATASQLKYQESTIDKSAITNTSFNVVAQAQNVPSKGTSEEPSTTLISPVLDSSKENTNGVIEAYQLALTTLAKNFPTHNGHPMVIQGQESRSNNQRYKANKKNKFSYSSSNIHKNSTKKKFDSNEKCVWCGRIGHKIEDCFSHIRVQEKERQIKGLLANASENGFSNPRVEKSKNPNFTL